MIAERQASGYRSENSSEAGIAGCEVRRRLPSQT